MDELVTKSFGGFTIKDESRGEVEAIIARIGAVDSDGDVFLKGSTPKGAKIKLSAYGHDVVLQNAPPAGVAEVFEQGDDIVLRGRFFLTTERGRESFLTVKELGADGEWSIGFPNNSVVKGELTDDLKTKGARRAIAGYIPMEGSPVFRGAQKGTRTLSVKMTKAAESLTGRLEAVHEALWARNDGLPQPWYAREVFEDYIIVGEGYGKTLRVPYTMDGETVSLGEPVEVEVVYQPVGKSATLNVNVDGVDPSNPLHQDLIAQARKEYEARTAPPISTDVEIQAPETKAEPIDPTVFEQGVLATITANLGTAASYASALAAKEAATAEAARHATEMAARRTGDEMANKQANDIFAQFEKTRRRLSA